MRPLIAVVLGVVSSSCGLFGDDDPPKDDAGRDASDGAGDGAGPDPSEGALRGAWPQASIGRPGGVRPEALALGWTLADGAAPGTGTGFVAASCPGTCDGACGIAFELADDRRIADLQVAVGSDDEVFINVVEGPDAQHLEDGHGHRSRILRAVVREDLLGRDELRPDLAAAAFQAGLEHDGEAAFLARDLMIVDHPDGEALLAIGHVFRAQGDVWALRDVALGLDPLTGRVRFVMKLPAEVFTITRPFEPTYQAFGARLLSDGRLVMWRDGFVETAGAAYVAAMPRDGETVELTPLALEEEGFPFSVARVEVDADDRLYMIGDELVTYPLCDADMPVRPRARLRVFAAPISSDAALLHDEGGIARSFESVTGLHVATSGVDTQVFVSGRTWRDPACADAIQQYPKASDTFSADEDSLTDCPERLAVACASGPCACSGCQGLQQLCPPPLSGPPPPDLVYLVTLGPDAAPRSVRAFPVPAAGAIATNGGTRALVVGDALSLLDLSDDARAPVIWTLPGWSTESGIGETSSVSLYGGWQTPLFSADGTRFVTGLLATHTHNIVLDGGAIEHQTTQRGGVASGVLTPGEGLVSLSAAREVVTTSNLVATAETDRVFPLGSGRLLHVFSWRGPAPILADPPTVDRRLELHLLTPGEPSYARGRDILPLGGEPIPVIARCTDTTRDALDACAHRLGAAVSESEVNLQASGEPAPPREVQCQERDRDGVLIAGCDVATLRARWEDTQGETLGRATSGVFTVRCATPSVRRVPLDDQAVELRVGCPSFSERFHPFASASLISVRHRATPGCDVALAPTPLRAVLARVPFDVHVTDEAGAPVDEGEVGVVIVLTTNATGHAGASATYTIVSGSGVLDGDGTEVSGAPGQPVDLEPTAEGVIVIRVRLFDEDGNIIGEQEIAIAIEGASGCTGNADATTFQPCHPRLPYPPPAAPGRFEPRTSTAEAAVGVLLHDRSLRLVEVDVASGDDGLALALARTYRSAAREDGGGLMGGWHFALDVRLAPVTPGDSAGQDDPTWLLTEDLAAGTHFDVAIADGGGRVDTYRHPSTTEVVDFGSGPAWWVWDAAAGTAVRKSFRARVATYTSPVDQLATLRSYTLLLDAGQAASDVHPYWHADRGFRPNERRFYELSEPDGLRRIFDCKGRLVLVIDAQLRELELVYAGPTHPLTRTRRLAAVIDAANRRWDIAWQTVGLYPRISRVTDPFGRTLDYHYSATPDGDARLSEVRWHGDDPDPAKAVTKVTRHRYDASGRLVAIVDEVDGAERPRLAVTWDGERVASQHLGDAQDAERWSFSGSGQSVVVTDGRGTARTYTLGVVIDGPRVVVSEAHTRKIVDADPLSRAELDAIATTRWTHHPSGLIATETSPLGRVTTFTFSPEGLLTERREVAGALTRSERWRYENPNAALAPGFACHVQYGHTPLVGPERLSSLPAFDGAAPGRACQPSEEDLPTGTLLDGQSVTRRVRLDYVPGGPHRGAITRREVLESGQPQSTTTWTYPAASGQAPGHAGKIPETYVGLPATLAEEVPHPGQCDFETLTRASTTFERDARGNVTRTTLSRRGVPYVVVKAWDAADRAVETTVDPQGLAHVTRARYDHHDRVVEERQVIADDDPHGLLLEPAAPRDVVRRTYWDAVGRESAVSIDGGDAQMVELRAYDEAGGLVAVLGPSAGATDADIAAVMARLEGGARPSALVAELEPRAAGASNYTSSTPSGAPASIALDARWVIRATTLDADGLPVRLETSGGAGSAPGCEGCEPYRRVEVSHRDLEGRLRVFDPGRTDRGDGALRVLVEHRFDGFGRIVEKRTIDPEGCAGPTTVVRRELMSELGADGSVGAIEVRGESGHAEACQTDELLKRTTWTFDASGRMRTRSEARFALLGALEPDPGSRVTTFEWDVFGRPTGELTRASDGTGAGRTLTRYALANAACWVGSGDLTSLAIEVKRDTDELGFAQYETELHHGPDGTVTVQSAFEHDAVGRVTRARDGFFQIRRELAWDSLGRVRAERDVRGAIHESRYDGLGQLVAATTHLASGTRTTELERRAGFVVHERALAIEDGATLPRGERAWRYDALARAAVVFPRGAAVPGEAVVTAHGADGLPLVQRTASGITLRHAHDALGNLTRSDATFPASLPPGWRVPAGHTLDRTAARAYRYDGLGRVTEASTFTASGARLSHLSRDWDSLSNVLRDLQDLDPPSGRTQHTDSFAVYDHRGRALRVEADRGRNDRSAVVYGYDDLDRIVSAEVAEADRGAPGLWELAYPQRIAWSWTGALASTRTVEVGSGFDASLRTTFTTRADHDELGQRYRVRHGVGGDLPFYEHRVWYWAGDPVVEKAVMFDGGDEQGDLGPTLAGLQTRGASHLFGRPPASLFSVPEAFSSYDDNPWESRYDVREHDDEGLVVRSVTHRYAPYSGALSLSARWQTFAGGRAVRESSLLYDPDKDKAIEARHARFTWSADGAHIDEARHLLVRKVNGAFGEPAVSDTTLLGVAPERDDALRFTYGGESQAAHDGCDPNESGACDANARHHFVYDPWGQLEYVAAREPDACKAPGPGMDDVYPVAHGLRLVHDALGRRVLERWVLPDGCAGPSQLPAERDRSFVHLGDALLEERVHDGPADAGLGIIRRVPGPDGIAWLAVRFGGVHRGHFVVFGDASDGLAGFYDVTQKALVQAGAPLPWFRAHQVLPLDETVSVAMRLTSTSGHEHQPMGKLAFLPGTGYALDLHNNPLADRWYATLHATEGFFESLVHKALLALDGLALATAVVPLVGDVVGLVADLARVAWDLFQDGPSWGLAGRTLAALGFAAVGLVANLGGPPAWGVKATVRARAIARAVNALDAGVDVARGADAVLDTSRVARDLDKLEDVSHLPDPGAAYLPFTPHLASEAQQAGMRLVGSIESIDAAPRVAQLFQRVRHLFASAPIPILQRKVFDQNLWGGITGRDACGPTAVAMILSDFGIHLNHNMRRLVSAVLGHVGAGTNELNLVRGLRAMGLSGSRVYNATSKIDGLRAATRASLAGHHVIAAITVTDKVTKRSWGHWILIDRIVVNPAARDFGYALVRNPSGRAEVYRLDELYHALRGPLIAAAR